MKFSHLADTFAMMENTTKRLELTQYLVKLFKKTPPEVISHVTYLLQGKLRPNYEGIELGVADKIALKAISKSAGIPLKRIEKEYQESGDLGHAASKILQQKTQTTFLVEPITVERMYDTLFKVAKLQGSRSQDMKMKYISSLLNDASPTEARFILKIITGTLRLGIADNTIMDSLAIAFTSSKENRTELERAYNVSSDLGSVAEAIAKKGLIGITDFQVSIFKPVRPMLAERVKSPQEAQEKMGKEFAAEYKLDGERVQIHLEGDKVLLYSRSLEDITSYYPDIVWVLFAQTIPSVVMTFFRDMGTIVIMGAVFFFTVLWLIRSRPRLSPKHYFVIVYDVFGNECLIDGLRTEFRTHDVAWSFMKQYKKLYSLCNFALVSNVSDSEKKTIFRYI